MAANKHTNSIPTDPLGRPCPIASGLADLADSPESIDAARELSDYWLAHRLAQQLEELSNRIGQMNYSLELALPLAFSAGDMQLEALLTMAKEYALETTSRAFTAHGHVLVAAERLAAQNEAKH